MQPAGALELGRLRPVSRATER